MLIFSSSLLFSIILLFFQQRNNRFHSFMEDHVTCVTKRRSTFSTITEFQLDSREIDFSTCPYLLPFSFFFLFFLCFSFFFFSPYLARVLFIGRMGRRRLSPICGAFTEADTDNRSTALLLPTHRCHNIPRYPGFSTRSPGTTLWYMSVLSNLFASSSTAGFTRFFASG